MANFDGFDRTTPTGTGAVSDGDNEFRSTKSYLQFWFEQEHFATDGSASSAGVHKIGTARCYSQSAAPTAVNIGEMWHDSDVDTFFVAEAAGTESWTALTSSIALASVNTWTALQNFSSNITVADISVTGAVANILSAEATINVASIAAGGVDTANTITVTGATVGSPVVMGRTTSLDFRVELTGVVNAADTVTLIFNNTRDIPVNPGSQAYVATVFNKP